MRWSAGRGCRCSRTRRGSRAPEDVAVRVLPDGDDGSRVDIRSSSRYFEGDLGSNAARVTKLIEDINTAAEAANAKPAVKKAPAPAQKGPPAKNVKKQS